MKEQCNSILVVDDDFAIRSLVETLLRLEGYEVRTAIDGLAALDFLQANHDTLDAVLLDWLMPRMNGIELLRWMKQQMSLKHLPVIMLTGMDHPSNIREGIQAGAFYYLTKPFQNDTLQSIVRAAVSDYCFRNGLLHKLKEIGRPLLPLEGTFRFRTIAEAELLALRIASTTPDPEQAIIISELMINAVEHGNLGITYEDKTRLVDEGAWSAEVDRRLLLPDNIHKEVHVRIFRRGQDLVVEITDAGSGFDFTNYLKFDEHRVFENHGRGIAMAKTTFGVEFIGTGNKVVVAIPL